MDTERDFPDWKQLYDDKEVETMPWFYPGLDPDLEKALSAFHIDSGSALDIGTGPATQAIALAERGFHVTGTDLSDTAIRKARIRAEEAGLDIDFRQDDVLDSSLEIPFDLVFDRGLFHTLPPDMRQDYVNHIHDLVRPEGYLFVKCFHHHETMEPGPYRFSPEELEGYFSGPFDIVSIKETVFQGTLDPPPKAFFVIMQKPGIR